MTETCLMNLLFHCHSGKTLKTAKYPNAAKHIQHLQPACYAFPIRIEETGMVVQNCFCFVCKKCTCHKSSTRTGIRAILFLLKFVNQSLAAI